MIQLINTIIHIIAQLKRKPVDVESNTHIDHSKDVSDKDPEFKIGDFAKIS